MGNLVILRSPYRSLSRPIRRYVIQLLQENPDTYVQVILGQLRTGSAMAQLLHQNSHFIEQLALQDLDRVVTTVLPIQLQTLEATLVPDVDDEEDGEVLSEEQPISERAS